MTKLKNQKNKGPTAFTGLARSVNALAKKVSEMYADHKLLRIDFETARCSMEGGSKATLAFQEASVAERKAIREELAKNTELGLAERKEMREELTANTEITRSIETKINTFRPDVFALIVAEHESRAAVRAWINRCFSSGTRIVITAAAIVAVIAGGSGFVSWLLSHIK